MEAVRNIGRGNRDKWATRGRDFSAAEPPAVRKSWRCAGIKTRLDARASNTTTSSLEFLKLSVNVKEMCFHTALSNKSTLTGDREPVSAISTSNSHHVGMHQRRPGPSKKNLHHVWRDIQQVRRIRKGPKVRLNMLTRS